MKYCRLRRSSDLYVVCNRQPYQLWGILMRPYSMSSYFLVEYWIVWCAILNASFCLASYQFFFSLPCLCALIIDTIRWHQRIMLDPLWYKTSPVSGSHILSHINWTMKTMKSSLIGCEMITLALSAVGSDRSKPLGPTTVHQSVDTTWILSTYLLSYNSILCPGTVNLKVSISWMCCTQTSPPNLWWL